MRTTSVCPNKEKGTTFTTKPEYKEVIIARFLDGQRRELTPKERKKVVATYLEKGTLSATSKITGLSVPGVRKVLDKEPEFLQQYEKKREQEAQELFGAISAKSAKFTKFCDAYFDELTNPEMVKRLARTDMEKLTKIFAINLDKFVLLNKMRLETDGAGDNTLSITITRKAKRDASDKELNEMFEDDE